MGCGIADLAGGVYQRPKLKFFGFLILSPVTSTRGASRGPLRPKSAIPHPITIQNMRFEQ